MTSLVEVACHIPERSESIREAGERLGVSLREQRLFEKFFGLREIRVAPERTYADRLVDAAEKLRTLRGNESRIKYFIAARTFRDVVPASQAPVQEAADRLGLHRALSFSVTEHACASGLLALWTAGWLLRDDEPDAMALLVTGEHAPLEGFYLPETSIMGDSTAACLVTADGARDRLRSYAYRMNPSIEETMEMAVMHSPDMEDVISKYSSVSAEELKKFYTEEVARVICEAVDQAGITLDRLSLILPHNVNRISWVRICRSLGYPVESVMLDYVPITGHCYTADGFLNYTEAKRQGRLREDEYYMIVGVGMGGSFAAMVFQH
jgi:3-oxoacyl-[acyl-carrier-protein] synthase-3